MTPELSQFASESIWFHAPPSLAAVVPRLDGGVVLLSWALVGGVLAVGNGVHLRIGNDPRSDSPEAETPERSKTLMCASVLSPEYSQGNRKSVLAAGARVRGYGGHAGLRPPQERTPRMGTLRTRKTTGIVRIIRRLESGGRVSSVIAARRRLRRPLRHFVPFLRRRR